MGPRSGQASTSSAPHQHQQRVRARDVGNSPARVFHGRDATAGRAGNSGSLDSGCRKKVGRISRPFCAPPAWLLAGILVKVSVAPKGLLAPGRGRGVTKRNTVPENCPSLDPNFLLFWETPGQMGVQTQDVGIPGSGQQCQSGNRAGRKGRNVSGREKRRQCVASSSSVLR